MGTIERGVDLDAVEDARVAFEMSARAREDGSMARRNAPASGADAMEFHERCAVRCFLPHSGVLCSRLVACRFPEAPSGIVTAEEFAGLGVYGYEFAVAPEAGVSVVGCLIAICVVAH